MTEPAIIISASPALPAELKVGVPIQDVYITAHGGTAPYTYKKYVESGLIPKGLKFDVVTGKLSGTPSESGKFSFYLGATDKNGHGGQKGDNGWKKFEGEVFSSKTSEIFEISSIEYVHLEGDASKDSRDRSLIYANGRHQLELMIRLSAKDKKGNPLHFDPKDLAENLWLIDYDTGTKLKFYDKVDFGKETLDKTPDDSIYYTTQRTRFCPETHTSTSLETNPDYKSALFYISVGKTAESVKIGIQLSLGNGKFIDTTQHGTKDKLGNGEVYRSNLTPFQVVGIEKIDFSDTSKLRIVNKIGHQTGKMWRSLSDFEVSAHGMHIHYYTTGLLINTNTNNYYGNYRRAVLAIESSDAGHPLKFWDTHHSSQWYERDGGPSPKMVSGSADIVWRRGTAIVNYYVDWPRYGYDDSLVWYRFEGPDLPDHPNYYYTITLEDGDHSTPKTSFENENRKDYLTISATIVDFGVDDIPRSFAPQNSFHSDGKAVRIDVYDLYGNGGKLNITQDIDDFPGLRINGALL